MKAQRISIADRLIAGFLFAFAVGTTAICLPVGLILLTRGKGIEFLTLFRGFSVWEPGLLILSGVLGVALGPERSMVLLGHLWDTEQPRKIAITLVLWGAIICVVTLSYFVVTKAP